VFFGTKWTPQEKETAVGKLVTLKERGCEAVPVYSQSEK
jgi:hypothetical protein